MRCDDGYNPVNIDATDAGVHGAAVKAKAALRFSFAKASSTGDVGRSYPYPLKWSARSVSSIRKRTLGRSLFHSRFEQERSERVKKQSKRVEKKSYLFMARVAYLISTS
jgi:hypothetical protein